MKGYFLFKLFFLVSFVFFCFFFFFQNCVVYAELMFARKIRSIFDRLLPCPKKKMHNKENFSTKKYTPGDSFLQELPRWKMFLGGWNYFNWKSNLYGERKKMYMQKARKPVKTKIL